MPNIAVLQESGLISGLVGTYASNCTNGSALCCAITNANAGITYTCSDPTNGAWTQANNVADSATNHSTATFYLSQNTGTTKLVVTIVSTGGSGSEFLQIAEIGSTSGFDKNAAANNDSTGTGADAQTSGNATPSAQPGLIWSYIRRAAGSGTLTNGTNFTAGSNLDGTIKTVTLQGLIVIQEVKDPLSLVKQREVRKLLRSLEDAKE